MSIEKELQSRSNSSCELCSAQENLAVYPVSPADDQDLAKNIYACDTCRTQMEDPETVDSNHWRCLNDSMWSQVPAVQVISWRMLHRLRSEGWSGELIDMMYMDEDTLAWAKESGDHLSEDDKVVHKDSNGAVLEAGDTVVLIKDLNVKGASFTAKRGTAVRRISLVEDNPEHIEGKVNDQRIVILTRFVKKSK
ncbi:MAG: PhnA protein [Bacteroidetes bacterium]|nr:PhnA protein [Bacteroidota bacterium]